MKKSNTLMLSYMIFLLIALLLNVYFKWDGLDKISMAATIAGCFFAFADLSSWYISYRKPMVDALQKDFESLIDCTKASLNCVRSEKEECIASIALLIPYKDRFNSVEGVITSAKDLLETNENKERNLQEILDGCTESQKDLNKLRKSLKRREIIEPILFTAGFVSFFLILSFEQFASALISVQSLATVIAFIIIMLNYYLRDLLDEKSKNEVDAILSQIQTEKAETERLMEKANQTPILDEIKSTVEEIRRFDEGNGGQE